LAEYFQFPAILTQAITGSRRAAAINFIAVVQERGREYKKRACERAWAAL